jgi:hypothetical protein
MLLGNTALGVGIIVVSIEASGISLTEISSISIQQNPLVVSKLEGSEVTYAAQPLRLRGA